MAYLTSTDLQTHIYGENITAITRSDATLVTRAIDAAIAEAKSYMGRYNIAYLFWDGVTLPKPTGAGDVIQDENLKNKVKDLAAWHLIKLANPNINLDLFRTGYEDAIDWFKGIMRGQSAPFGWPLRVDDPTTDYVEGGALQWSANKKRDNKL